MRRYVIGLTADITCHPGTHRRWYKLSVAPMFAAGFFFLLLALAGHLPMFVWKFWKIFQYDWIFFRHDGTYPILSFLESYANMHLLQQYKI